MKEDYAFAENQLNALFGTHSWFTPALVEKARLAFVKVRILCSHSNDESLKKSEWTVSRGNGRL